MKAVMGQYIYSLRGFHPIRQSSLAPPIERWLDQGTIPRWNWLETNRNDYLIPTIDTLSRCLSPSDLPSPLNRFRLAYSTNKFRLAC